MKTLQDRALQALHRDPSEPSIHFEGHTYLLGDMRRVAERLAELVAASGAHPQAPVILLGRNRPSALAALIGLIAAGRNIQMVYPFQAPAAVAGYLTRLNAAVVVAAAQDFPPEVRDAMQALGSAAIVLSEMDAAALPGFERSGVAFEPKPGAALRVEVLSSGTTGPPKQFPITYESLNQIEDLRLVDADGEVLPPMLQYMPVGNISGLYSNLPPLLSGQQIVLLDRFNVEAWRDYVRRYKPVHFGLLASCVPMVLDAGVPKEDLASVKTLTTGGAGIDPTVLQAWMEKYGIPILSSYGATEFCGPVARMTPDLYETWGAAKFNTAGLPTPGAKVRVVDPDTGDILPAGQVGRFEVVAPRVGPDWIRTADLGLIDDDGFLFMHGRLDGAITRGGFKIVPDVIENALMLHEALAACVVVGAPDRRLGQVPAAAIQVKQGAKAPSVEVLTAHLRERLLATQIPVYWRFLDTLPMNQSMKFDRRAITQMFAELQPT